MKTAPSSALVMEGATSDSLKVKIIHHGGDTLVDAFKSGTNNGSWNNIEVRKNGATCILNHSEFNGDTTWNPGTENFTAFEPGDELKLIITSPGLNTSDSIVILYDPTGDILQRTVVA